MKCLCFPLSIKLNGFTEELSDYMSCPYKYNQTERELNRCVFNILTFMLMGLPGQKSKVICIEFKVILSICIFCA